MHATRIAAGVTCMLSVGWGVSAYQVGDLPWEAIALFIGSFATWAFAEYRADAAPARAASLHPHDIELGNKLRGILDENMKRYLRSRPFASSFRFESVEPLGSLAKWSGLEREFENADLDNLASEVIRLSGELDDKLADANALEHRLEFGSLVPDAERISDWHSAETSKMLADVHCIADQLAEAGDNFERVFRGLSPESYRKSGGA